jgi:quinoprotein dehydrogenase-associated probable ABC transporter substrate-binding protein
MNTGFYRLRLRLAVVLLAVCAGSLSAQRPAPLTPGLLRVCADPANMPFSDSTGAGMENKLAELMAKTWNAKLEYVWWASPRGLFARALNGRYCDVVLEAPAGFDMAGVTKPYYRTSYVAVQRHDVPHVITSLDDPALKTMKIGVHLYSSDAENSPPAMALSAHGVVGNLVGFGTVFMGDHDRPEQIIQAVIDKSVDIAFVWGPLAGYYAKKLGADLVITPIGNDSISGIPFVYSMGMATRRREHAFKDSLEKFIDTKAPEIQALLQEYGIPLLPLPADSVRGTAAGGPAR